MQGWRKRQEDAHIAAVSQGEKKNIDVFGVLMGMEEKKYLNLFQIILLKN